MQCCSRAPLRKHQALGFCSRALGLDPALCRDPKSPCTGSLQSPLQLQGIFCSSSGLVPRCFPPATSPGARGPWPGAVHSPCPALCAHCSTDSSHSVKPKGNGALLAPNCPFLPLFSVSPPCQEQFQVTRIVPFFAIVEAAVH